MKKCYKIISAIKKLTSDLTCEALLSHFRPVMDYGDTICKKPINDSFEKQNQENAIYSMYSNNKSSSRDIQGTPLLRIGFRISA